MERQVLVGFVGFLLLCTTARALEPPGIGQGLMEWNLTFYSQNKPLPADSLIEVRYPASGGAMAGQYQTATILATRENGSATLYSRQKRLAVRFVRDDPVTPAEDEAWTGELDLEQWAGEPIILQPMAYLAGRVDGADGKAAAGALIELVCDNGYGRSWNASASGAFELDGLRPGACVLSASEGGLVARQDVVLRKGELTYAILELGENGLLLALYGLAGLAALALLWSAARRWRTERTGRPQRSAHADAKRKSSRHGQAGREQRLASQRQNDLMATLWPEERKIMEYLLKNAPAVVKAAKLRRELLIPKTSFWRLMLALERKQMLVVKKDGSRSFISLHEFFRREG